MPPSRLPRPFGKTLYGWPLIRRSDHANARYPKKAWEKARGAIFGLLSPSGPAGSFGSQSPGAKGISTVIPDGMLFSWSPPRELAYTEPCGSRTLVSRATVSSFEMESKTYLRLGAALRIAFLRASLPDR